MNWNPVLKKCLEIKKEYEKRFGVIVEYETDEQFKESKTCLERWVSELNRIETCEKYQEYETIVSFLLLTQHKNFLLVKYGRYNDIYGQDNRTIEDFWNCYDGFYRECRSVVIDLEKECIVLAPFAKFFNINELEETNLENVQKRISKAKNVEFSDKLDGSMQSARWYDGRIVMAGSQALDPKASWRLQDGYRMINSLPGYGELLRKYDKYTFIFEYISLKDAHVVKYTEEQEGLYLIGIRNVEDGTEYDYRMVLALAEEFHVPATKLFDKTMEQVMAELDDKSSEEAEGFVINMDGYRVKLKYNDYVHIHKVLSQISSPNLIIQSIAEEKYDDLLAKIPAVYHKEVKHMAGIIINYINQTEQAVFAYYKQAPKEDKKAFMLYVSEHVPMEYQGYCRELYLGREINVLKSGTNKSPHYRRWKDICGN